MLDERFSQLASNHEELIKFKDEYKRQNKHLRTENTRLKEENRRLFSKVLEEKDQRVQELEAELGRETKRCQVLEQKNKWVLLLRLEFFHE